MTNRTKTLITLIVTTLLLVGVPAMFLPGQNFGADDDIKKNKVKDELKIKAEKKSDVLYSYIKNDKVHYVYKSKNIVPKQTRYLEDGKLVKEKKEKKDKKTTEDTLLGADEIIEEDISKRTYNSLSFPLSESTTTSEIYSGPAFYYTNPDWYEIEFASTTVEAYNVQMEPELDISTSTTATTTYRWINPLIVGTALADSLTAYPSIDGKIRATLSTWDAAHDATTGSADSTGSEDNFAQVLNSSGNRAIDRGVLFFDTSSIGSSDTISAASLNLWVTGVRADDNDGNDFIGVVQGTGDIVSSAALNDTDYDELGDAIDNPTEGTDTGDRKDISSGITTGQYTAWTFNATGMGWIARSGETLPVGAPTAGVTYLGVREGHDILDDAPDIGTAGDRNRIVIRYSNYTGTANDPYLSVTYSAGGGGSSRRIILIQ